METAFNPENLDSIKLRIAINTLVLDISSHTAAAVDIAPPIGQNQGPGSDNSPTHVSKKSKGKEFVKSTSPPSSVPPIWFTVSTSLINLEAKNLTHSATASAAPVSPIKKFAPVSVVIPETNKETEKIPRIKYECFPDNLNSEINMFIGQAIGKINKSKKFLARLPFPVAIQSNCFTGKMISQARLITFFLVGSGAFFINSSFSPLIATTMFKLLALYAENTTVINVSINPLEKAINKEMVE